MDATQNETTSVALKNALMHSKSMHTAMESVSQLIKALAGALHLFALFLIRGWGTGIRKWIREESRYTRTWAPSRDETL
eukprot:1160907-Pelagomonas_calceolata.AAC.5